MLMERRLPVLFGLVVCELGCVLSNLTLSAFHRYGALSHWHELGAGTFHHFTPAGSHTTVCSFDFCCVSGPAHSTGVLELGKVQL